MMCEYSTLAISAMIAKSTIGAIVSFQLHLSFLNSKCIFLLLSASSCHYLLFCFICVHSSKKAEMLKENSEIKNPTKSLPRFCRIFALSWSPEVIKKALFTG